MSNWKSYKETFNLSEDIFSLARSGDTNKLREFVGFNHELNFDKKNDKGYSPLMIAVYNGNIEAAEFLLEIGADPNSADLSGNTILMGAAFKGDVGLTKILLKRDANKDAKNHNGSTAEQWASAFGRMDVVSILKPEASYSRSQNMMNKIKIIWGFLKPTPKREAIA